MDSRYLSTRSESVVANLKENSNISERVLSNINTSVFFKEFTFEKTEFYPEDGQKELADNIVSIDELLFIFQVKERNLEESIGNTDKWFKNKVLKKAKDQIKDTLDFLVRYKKIPIKNKRNQIIDVANCKKEKVRKIIIYKCDTDLSQKNSLTKFYKSKEVGIIHIFDLSNYFNICNYLITPKELDDYLDFREKFIDTNSNFIANCSEKYLISHFLNTNDPTKIDSKYIENLENYDPDKETYQMSHFFNIFYERIKNAKKDQRYQYHLILAEIAKLRRYELSAFKERFYAMTDMVKRNEWDFPFRYYCQRTDCAFVFIPLADDKIKLWERTLINFTEVYKYKRRATKAIGIVSFKTKEFIDLNWTLFDKKWEEDQELDSLDRKLDQVYGEGKRIRVPRYKFKSPN